jgi:hypothetical protein
MAGTGITYAFEVAWGGSVEGLFRIGVSTVDGTDVISGWPADAGFESVTDDTVGFYTERGRSDDQAQLMAGTATIRLRDQSGKYNPANSASILHPNVAPFKAVRITATYDTTDYPIFYGFITSIDNNPSPQNPFTTLECADLFAWLTQRSPTIASTGTTTTGAAIGSVLDEISWPNTLRDLGIGDTIGDFSADGTKTSLELIRELLEAEMGAFNIAGNGKATFRDRNSRFQTSASSSTIDGASETLMSFQSTNRVDTIFNSATVTRTGGTAQTASDTDSINTFGQRDLNALTTSYVADDTAALSRAKLRVLKFKDPKTPAVAGMESSSSTTAAMLARELGDRVTITEPFGNTDKQYWVEAIEQTSEAHAGAQRHLTQWRLSETPTSAAQIPVIIDITGVGNYIGA